jgi:hypothetical protein
LLLDATPGDRFASVPEKLFEIEMLLTARSTHCGLEPPGPPLLDQYLPPDSEAFIDSSEGNIATANLSTPLAAFSIHTFNISPRGKDSRMEDVLLTVLAPGLIFPR